MIQKNMASLFYNNGQLGHSSRVFEYKPPKPESHPIRYDHRDCTSKFSSTHKVGRNYPRQIVSHVNDTGDSEARWTDRNEHCWARAFDRQFLRHKSIQEGRVDHERHHKTNALQYEPTNYNVKRFVAIEPVCDVSCEWTDNQKRIRREDPDRGHLCDCKSLSGPSAHWLDVESNQDFKNLQYEIDRTRETQR